MDEKFEINRFKSKNDLFKYLVDLFFDTATLTINTRGYFNIAVSGGTTPVPFFQLLKQECKRLKAWSRVNFFWVDERWVPAKDAQSNYGEAMRAGLSTLEANFYPFQTSYLTPEHAADKYSNEVAGIWNSTGGLAWVLLGAGADGHTASIFRHNLDKSKLTPVAFATEHPETKQIRLSLSFSSIVQAGEIFLILTGEEKRNILESLKDSNKNETPIHLIIQEGRKVNVLTDLND